jgi:periplasmic protein TonB
MRLLVLFAVLLAAGSSWSQDTIREKTDYEPEPAVSESMARFPGGDAALHTFVRDHLLYPPTLTESAPEGKCYLRFVVSEGGKISNIEVLRGIPGCPECDKAAIDVFKHPDMPLWKPAEMNGEPVNSYFHYPVRFGI